MTTTRYKKERNLMKNAVIYARYSSEKQNEQSIEGQVNDCKAWAKDNDINILNIYHDEALTGRTDKRPAFQRMISEAKNGKFDYILVWKTDRFARNRYDSAIYKAQLKKHGVKVISVKEHISDAPEGIILESMLEGMAEYYSANLSQNVLRGMHQNAEQGKYLGGTVPLGYKIIDKKYIIDEDNATVVKKIYSLFIEGHSAKEICQILNSSGYKSSTGKPFTYDTVRRILTNKKYIGQYESMGVILEDAIPPIISKDIFDTAQSKIGKNKKKPAGTKKTVDFHLTGKLFCGKCESNMVGDSGTSSTKAIHYYYSCLEHKRKNTCKKKSVKKDYIEKLITDITINQVLTDENIDYISTKAFEIYEKDRNDKSELNALNKSLSEVQKIIDNLISAIEQGIITPTTKERLLDAENRKSDILSAIAKEEIKKPIITKEHIEFFLYDIKNKIHNSNDSIEIIIKTFVNAVYLYDDKITITFNFKEGETLKKLDLSDLESSDTLTSGVPFAFYPNFYVFAITIFLDKKH